MVLIDRFNDENNAIDAHLRDKFTNGITGLPYTAQMRLANIIGFHYSTIGQSHFPSLVDVALGSLRFAVNAHTRGQTQHEDRARTILGILSPLFWRERDAQAVSELGFIFSPKVVRSSAYLDHYRSLKSFLEVSGIATTQDISDQRMY